MNTALRQLLEGLMIGKRGHVSVIVMPAFGTLGTIKIMLKSALGASALGRLG